MAVKKVVPEKCPRCGQTQARQNPDGSVSVWHNCPNRPPGPPSYPVRFRPGEVQFQPAAPDGAASPGS